MFFSLLIERPSYLLLGEISGNFLLILNLRDSPQPAGLKPMTWSLVERANH